MVVKFYYNQSDDRQINKVLTGETTFEGVPRGDIDIMTPVIRFDSSDILRFNYCYIPELQRYYSVRSINAYREGLYDVTLEVDVLMSFRNHILRLECIVDKQAQSRNGDEYIDDGSLVTDNIMFNRVYNFSSGFNSTPEFILITAG